MCVHCRSPDLKLSFERTVHLLSPRVPLSSLDISCLIVSDCALDKASQPPTPLTRLPSCCVSRDVDSTTDEATDLQIVCFPPSHPRLISVTDSTMDEVTDMKSVCFTNLLLLGLEPAGLERRWRIPINK